MKALEKDRSRRYETANAFANDIKRHLTNEPVLASPPSAAYRIGKFARRNRGLVVSGSIVAVALMIGFVATAFALVLESNQRQRADQAMIDANWQRQLAEIASTKAEAAAELADQQKETAERTGYLSSIRLAAVRIDDGDFPAAQKALLETPEYLRNWEWGYLVTKAWPRRSVDRFEEPPVGATAAEIWDGALGRVVSTIPPEQTGVSNIDLDPSGSKLLRTAAGEVSVWGVATGKKLFSIPGSSGKFSNDGNVIATRQSGDVVLVHAESGKTIRTVPGAGKGGYPGTIRFSPNDRFLVVQGQGIRVIDVETGEVIGPGFVVNAPLDQDGDGIEEKKYDLHWTWDFAFEDGFEDRRGNLLFATAMGRLISWNPWTNETEPPIQGPSFENAGAPLSIGPHRDRVVSCNPIAWGPLLVWDPTTGRELFDFGRRSGNRIVSAEFSKDGTVIVCGTLGGEVIVLDASDGKRISTTSKHPFGFSIWGPRLKMSDNGSRIAVIRRDFSINILGPDTGDSHSRDALTGHSDHAINVRFSPDGTRLATASYDGTCILWDARTRAKLATLEGHTAELRWLRFSPQGKYVLTASWDGTQRLWDATTGDEIKVLSKTRVGGMYTQPWGGPETYAGNYPPHSPFTADDRLVVTSGEPGATVFDTATREPVATLDGNGVFVSDAAFSPDGKLVITREESEDRRVTLKVWSTSDWNHLYDLRADDIPYAFSPDVARVAIVRPNKTVGAIVDVATGEEVLPLEGHTSYICSVKFTPDGRYVLTAANDNTARVWDAQTGVETATLRGHAIMRVLHASFSPDGMRILTCARDNTVKVWDLQGNELVTLPFYDWASHAIWSPDGNSIATAHNNGSARIWEAVPWNELKVIGDSKSKFDEKLRLWRERRDL